MASISANGSRGHHKFTLNVNETYVSGRSGQLFYYKLVVSTISCANWLGLELFGNGPSAM